MSADAPADSPHPAPGSSEHVTRVVRGDREFLLVGTAHVSRKSAEEVESVIRETRPDSVCVELDAARYETLVDETRWQRLSLSAILEERRAGLFLASVLFAGFQRRLGLRMGTRPGAEMLAAAQAAQGVGATLVFADRDVQTTLSRCRASLGVVDRMKVAFLLALLPFASPDLDEAQVEELKTKRAMADAMETFAQQMPALKTPLIDERDRFLAGCITEAPGNRVVAVVGAAHAAGVAKLIGTPIDRAAISTKPPDTHRDRLTPICVSLLVALVLGASANGGGTASAMLAAGRMAAPVMAAVLVAVLVAGVHGITALAALVATPISVLAPLLPIGPSLGALQARLRPPTPDDATRLRDDVLAPRRARQNPFLKATLIAVLVPPARTAGAIVGIVWALLGMVRG